MESHQHLAEEQSQLHNYDWAVIAGINADDLKYKKIIILSSKSPPSTFLF